MASILHKRFCRIVGLKSNYGQMGRAEDWRRDLCTANASINHIPIFLQYNMKNVEKVLSQISES